MKRYTNSVFMIMCVIAQITFGMQKTQENPAETMACGGIVGIAEGITGVPCVQVKNHLQAKKSIQTFPVRRIYSGFGVNAFAAGPATVVQYGVNNALKAAADETRTAHCATAAAAGIAGAVVATPSEALILRAIQSKGSFLQMRALL